MSISAGSDPVPAHFGPRFSAWMIDACLLFGVQWIAVIVLARQLQAAGLSTIEPCSVDSPLQCEGPNTALWVVLFLLIVVSTFGYHAWFDGVLGSTPGKRWMGLRVVDAATDSGGPIGLGRGLLRAVVRQGIWIWAFLLLAASPISVGVPSLVFFALFGAAMLTFVVGAFSASTRALHDLVADTRVVAASEARVTPAVQRTTSEARP